ncbi:MAG: hypothetical protein IJT41_09670 [Clostridia bacterium]|nr:hypothetical protein [Clostridia bacterium]
MRNKVVQISLFDTYTDVLQTMEEEKSEFLSLMEKYIDFGAVMPAPTISPGMHRNGTHVCVPYTALPMRFP